MCRALFPPMRKKKSLRMMILWSFQKKAKRMKERLNAYLSYAWERTILGLFWKRCFRFGMYVCMYVPVNVCIPISHLLKKKKRSSCYNNAWKIGGCISISISISIWAYYSVLSADRRLFIFKGTHSKMLWNSSCYSCLLLTCVHAVHFVPSMLKTCSWSYCSRYGACCRRRPEGNDVLRKVRDFISLPFFMDVHVRVYVCVYSGVEKRRRGVEIDI